MRAFSGRTFRRRWRREFPLRGRPSPREALPRFLPSPRRNSEAGGTAGLRFPRVRVCRTACVDTPGWTSGLECRRLGTFRRACSVSPSLRAEHAAARSPTRCFFLERSCRNRWRPTAAIRSRSHFAAGYSASVPGGLADAGCIRTMDAWHAPTPDSCEPCDLSPSHASLERAEPATLRRCSYRILARSLGGIWAAPLPSGAGARVGGSAAQALTGGSIMATAGGGRHDRRISRRALAGRGAS